MAYQGFTMGINGTASPWIAADFNLNQSGIARLFAWIALASIGALILTGIADRRGRRCAFRAYRMRNCPACSHGVRADAYAAW
jgi:MFS family permease